MGDAVSVEIMMAQTHSEGPAIASPIELTILMPCLDEALTVQTCVSKASAFLMRRGVVGEILVADNGSVDGSRALAQAAGARIVSIKERGYGAALRGGIMASRGRYVIMADADDSYDFSKLDDFLDALRHGVKLVVGNRFKGGIAPGAMPFLNRYLGNPVLSLLGRALFRAKIGDFHCGLRGFDRQAIVDLNLKATGMEFASEMVVKASLAALDIKEVPTRLCPDGRQRLPHLRPWRDGWRHLRFMLLRSPQWLFLYPGLLATALGALASTMIIVRPRHLTGHFVLDINAILYFSITASLGVQISYFGLLAMAVAKRQGIPIATGFPQRLLRMASFQQAIVLGCLLVLCGIAGAVYGVVVWGHLSFGALVPSQMMRITIPSVTVLAIGTQILFGALLLSFIDIE